MPFRTYISNIFRGSCSEVFLRKSILTKRCSENIQQIYRRTPMSKCDFTKVAKQLRHGSSLVNLLHIFRIPFRKNISAGLLLYIASLYSIEEISTSLQHSNTAERWEKTFTCAYLFIKEKSFRELFIKSVLEISKNCKIKTVFTGIASWKFENLNRCKYTWVFLIFLEQLLLLTLIMVWYREQDGVDSSCTERPNVLD